MNIGLGPQDLSRIDRAEVLDYSRRVRVRFLRGDYSQWRELIPQSIHYSEHEQRHLLIAYDMEYRDTRMYAIDEIVEWCEAT